MQLLTLDELRAYLWIYWCMADAATGHPTPAKMIGRRERGGTKRSPLTTDLAVRIREVLPLDEKLDRPRTEAVVAKLHRLIADELRSATSSTSADSTATFQALLMNFSFPDGFPDDQLTGGAADDDTAHDALLSGFVSANQALWFRPASEESAELLGSKLDNPRTAFAEGKTFTKKVLAFPRTERFRQWRDGEINVAKVLSATQKVFLRRIGVDAGDITFRGTVIIGRDPRFTGVTWIGVRDNERYAELSDEQRGRLLTAVPGCIRIMPSKTPARWVYTARVIEEIEGLRPEDFCAFALALGYHAIADAQDNVRFWPRYVGRGHVPDVPRLEPDDSVVVVSNGTATELEDEVITMLPAGFKGLIRIFAREHLPGEVSGAPDLWSAHLGGRVPFAVIQSRDEQRLAATLLAHGRSASEGRSITRSIEELVTWAASEFQPLTTMGDQVAQEYVLRVSRAIDEVIRKHRHAAQADTTPEIVHDNERWVRRVLDPYYDPLQPQRITFWLLLDNISLDLQSSSAAWHAALADDRDEFTGRLNASVRRIIFQRRMPVADVLERREIAMLPETPDIVELRELQEKQREIAREMFASFEKDAEADKELHDVFAPFMRPLLTRMETGWWEGAPQRDRVREVEDQRKNEALLAEPYIVQGRHGQGISTSLYQTIRRLHPAAVVIVVAASALVDGLPPYEMPLFSDILHHQLQERDVVVTGTCDADERTAARIVRFIATLEERFAAAPYHVRFRFGLYEERPVPVTGEVRVIRLGAMGAGYAQQLSAHVATTLGVQIEDGALAALGESFKDCDEGREVVRFFFTELPENLLTLRRAGAARPWSPPDPWTAKAEALRVDVARQYDVLLLQVIISIERLGIAPAPGYLVRRVVESFTNTSEPTVGREWRFKEAIHRFENEGWTGAENPKHNTEQRRYTCRHPKFALGDVERELIEWLLANPKLVDADDWRTLLGERAASYAWWREENTHLLERIVDAVVPTLDRDADLILTYAKQLADANLLNRAAALLDFYNGDSSRTQGVWLEVAKRHARELDDPSKFCEAFAKIDDERGRDVLRSELWHFEHGNRFEWFIAHVRRQGHLSTLERIAGLLDTLKPEATPSFRDRLAAHLAAMDEYKSKSDEPTT